MKKGHKVFFISDFYITVKNGLGEFVGLGNGVRRIHVCLHKAYSFALPMLYDTYIPFAPLEFKMYVVLIIGCLT